ncbi:hypothetical protein G9455_08350 [Aeromonas hydrophila]|uniref:hypothetical protein n=2 Tax=Aeromonas TaxID=642 RepID=UPI000332B512|nr:MULTISPECIES: hypothetical protein [Aeromonas]AGM44747.1 hypothetical protein AHML_14895 [Aeromonas hydrophila ML09-119]AJE35778.1 hypothetical protein V469_07705 [Aeromonas hydrophila J-1]AKJ33975.1 hypothetical protein U876_07675 [Aeromonas hydrophila NJ-35]ALQ62825.1 hypothetical protein AS145_07960 [Aeromonas hydrophila]ALZ79525.1 hypothetical protein AhyD4_07925 [Aeromonas hydrophila]
MGRTLEDMISSESPEVVQRAKALAEEQLVRLSVTKLLSNLGTGDVPEIDADVLNSLLSLKRSVERYDCRLSLLVHMPDGTHHGVNI